MYRSRDPKYLPKESRFNLGKFGWLVNAMVVSWAAFLTVIFSFPVQKPVTPGSMSKCLLSSIRPLCQRSQETTDFNVYANPDR